MKRMFMAVALTMMAWGLMAVDHIHTNTAPHAADSTAYRITIPYFGGSFEIDADIEATWQVSSMPDWLSIDPEGDTTDGLITLTVTATTNTEDSRVGTIILESTGVPPVQGTITVSQIAPIDVAMVIDRSASMGLHTSATTKLYKAKAAAAQTVALMGPGVDLSVVAYHRYAQAALPMSAIMTWDNLTSLRNSITTPATNIPQAPNTEQYWTSIGAGIIEGSAQLGDASFTNEPQGMILFSDGWERKPPYVGAALASVPGTAKVYSLGFGLDCNQAKMQQIANATGGLYYYAYNMSSDQISQTCLAVLTDLCGYDVLAMVNDGYTPTTRNTRQVMVDEGCGYVDFNFGWHYDTSSLHMSLIDPNGTMISADDWSSYPNCQLITYSNQNIIRIYAPKAGIWQALLGGQTEEADESYVFSATGLSTIKMQINPSRETQYGDQPYPVMATLTNDSIPIVGAQVVVTAVSNEDTTNTFELELFDDGMHGDELANDGIYSNSFTPLPNSGWTFYYKAVGPNDSFIRQSMYSNYFYEFTGTGSDVNNHIASVVTNYPNPFNPETNIRFTIGQAGHVSLNVYDVRGRMVSNLVDENLNAGQHTVVFKANGLASGVYFPRMQAAGQTVVKKMILVK